MGRLLLYRELKVELNMTHEFMKRDDRYALNSVLVNTLWQKCTHILAAYTLILDLNATCTLNEYRCISVYVETECKTFKPTHNSYSFIQMEISDAGVQSKQSSPLLKVPESHKSVKEIHEV